VRSDIFIIPDFEGFFSKTSALGLLILDFGWIIGGSERQCEDRDLDDIQFCVMDFYFDFNRAIFY
jgi:hypothetical protein